MPVRTRRWNDPAQPGDGFRVLICRYRPRGLRKSEETWDEWWKDVGPSAGLHAAVYGKHGPPIPWGEYRRGYLAEMRSQEPRILALAERVAAGGTVTLLCASSCPDESRCHRSLLRRLVEKAAARR